MKSIVNKVSITGRLGKDPIIRLFENGTRKATLLLSIQDSYLNTIGHSIFSTHWHRITAWGKTADQVERMLHKGTKISIEGRVRQTKLYVNEKAYKTIVEIILDEFEIHLEEEVRRLVRA